MPEVNALVNEPTDKWAAIWLDTFYGQRIIGGQALGQKNAILAAWLSQTYLTPIVAVRASAYIVWQNLFNAWQLWMERRQAEKIMYKAQRQTADMSYPNRRKRFFCRQKRQLAVLLVLLKT